LDEVESIFLMKVEISKIQGCSSYTSLPLARWLHNGHIAALLNPTTLQPSRLFLQTRCDVFDRDSFHIKMY
jgi:hypothetical protein